MSELKPTETNLNQPDDELDRMFAAPHLAGTWPVGVDDEEDVSASLDDVLADNFDEDVSQKLKQAIRTKYISRAEVAAAIGENEYWNDARLVPAKLRWQRQAENDMRDKLRRELGLEGDRDDQPQV